MKSIERIRDEVVFNVKYLSQYEDLFDSVQAPIQKEICGGFLELRVWKDRFDIEVDDGDWSQSPMVSLSFNSDVERYERRWVAAALLMGLQLNDYVSVSDKVKSLLSICTKIDNCEDDSRSDFILDMGRLLVDFGDDHQERKPKFQEYEIAQMSIEELKAQVRLM
jgi:hypothetical protein